MTKLHQYLPTTESGQIRRRVRQIVMDNPDPEVITGAMPTVVFQLEDQVRMADGTCRSIPVGTYSVLVDVHRLLKEFPAVNLDTGEVVRMSDGNELMEVVSGFSLDVMMEKDEQDGA